MEIDFLGVGWGSPVQLDDQGRVVMVKYEELVRQSILHILDTAKGERVMRPEFGCGIHERVFADNSAGTIGQIISDVKEALLLWEPRIEVLDVDAIPTPKERNKLNIKINYQVRTTNNIFNLVYPFYLQ